MNFAEISIKRNVISWMFTAFLTVGGVISYFNLGKLEDPEFTIKSALVFTQYPGADANQVAEEVTDPLERAIQQLPQLDYVESISRNDLSILTVEIKEEYTKQQLPQIWDELRRKIGDAQKELPPGCSPSLVNDDFGDVYGILFAISSDGFSYKEMNDYVKYIEKELLLVDGVAKVLVEGRKKESIYVEFSRVKLAKMGISLQEIFNQLGSQNVVVPAGATRVDREYIRIKPTGEINSVEAIRNLMINKVGTDKIIRLSDVAHVYRDYIDPPTQLYRFNSKPTIVVGVSPTPGSNVIDLGENVRAKMSELKKRLPVGIEVGTISFEGEAVDTAVANFLLNLLEAVIIVIAVLLIFMGLRSGLLIGTILLLTIAGTLIIMDMLSINMQRISLGALIIALGMLVDNAIVITEGMIIKIEAGVDRLKAAKDVVAQNMMPLLGATVIAVLAFAAIGVSKNNTGEYCRSLFQVIMISLMMSWVTAITLTPFYCYRFLKGPKSTRDGEEVDHYKGFIFTIYKKALLWSLKYRWLTTIILIIVLLISSWQFLKLEGSFFPPSTRNQYMINYWLPEGTDIRQTDEDISEISEYIQKDKRVKNVSTYTGKGAPRFLLTYSPEKNYSAYAFALVTVDNWQDIDDLVKENSAFLKTHYPHATIKVKKFKLGPGGSNDIEVRISGEDSTTLRDLSEKVLNIMRKDPACTALMTNWRKKTKQLTPVFAEDRARKAGVTHQSLSSHLAYNFSGYVAGVYREKDELIPIVARAPESDRKNIGAMLDVPIWSPLARKGVPASQFIKSTEVRWIDPLVMRRNRKRTITISCDAAYGLPSVLLKRIMPDIKKLELPDGYTMEWGGEFEDSTKAKKALVKPMAVSLLFMSIILVMLFNCFKNPFIIWCSVSLAIIGVVVGLRLGNEPFGFMALLGFLSLIGMLIKNAIVLLDQVEIEIREGKDPFEAIVISGVSRMRPVSMAAFTTVLGMLPLLFDPFFKGMACTIMGGLTFATVLVLIAVPVFYVIVFKVKYKEI